MKKEGIDIIFNEAPFDATLINSNIKPLYELIEVGKFYKVVINSISRLVVHYGYLLEKSNEYFVFDTHVGKPYIVKINDISIITEVENERNKK